MDRSTFEQLVADAIDALPEEFLQYMDNVAVVIEDEPSPQLLRSLGINPRHDTLFGLYEGVPLDQRGDTFAGVLPDKITIFYRPLVRAFRSPERLRREVGRTIVHEVGHFFGLDDDRIRHLGY